MSTRSCGATDIESSSGEGPNREFIALPPSPAADLVDWRRRAGALVLDSESSGLVKLDAPMAAEKAGRRAIRSGESPMHKPAIYPGLSGKTVFITGGGSGIGAAHVMAFSGQDAKVAFVDILEAESRSLVDRVAAETGKRPLFLHCDIRDIAALREAIERVRTDVGDISTLVNNAANDQRHKTEDVTVAYWDERMAVNLRPMFFACQAVVPQMKRLGGGVIVNFSSIAWRVKSPDLMAYVAAKSAVNGLTRGLAREFGPFNIRVNTVTPGWVMTERQIKLWLNPAAEARRAQSQCLEAKLAPEDLADMVLFLASDAASKCTAQEFVVDGGWS
jgi:NAD(P)-dependent dehydrogenase (short-subunit alcohol dehydrogenase family)